MSDHSSPIRVLAVDDHPLVRDGIAGLIAIQPDMTLVAQAANGRDAIQQFRTHRPDVTLMDIQMPEMNGLDALIAIRTEFPDAKVIVLTTYEGDVQILRAIKAGADVLGGRPHGDPDPQGHVDLMFALAQELDCPVDMSVDAIFPPEPIDPMALGIARVARKTLEVGYQGRVTVHHVLAVGAVPGLKSVARATAAPAAARVRIAPGASMPAALRRLTSVPRLASAIRAIIV